MQLPSWMCSFFSVSYILTIFMLWVTPQNARHQHHGPRVRDDRVVFQSPSEAAALCDAGGHSLD